MFQGIKDLVAMQRVHAEAAIEGRLNARRVERPRGLDADRWQRLAIALARLDSLRSGLGLRALRHVGEGGVDGGDDPDGSILLELAALEGGGQLLGLQAVGPRFLPADADEWRWRDLFAAPIPDDALLYLRLARVFEAASRREPRQVGQTTPPVPAWLEILLREIAKGWIGEEQPPETGLRFAQVEEMLVADDQPADLAVRAFVLSDPADYPWAGGAELFEQLQGRREAFGRHPEPVCEALKAGVSLRKAMLGRLAELDETTLPEAFVEPVVDAALGGAKTVRDAADPAIARHRALCMPRLRSRLVDGKAAERRRAARLLWRFDGEAARELLEAAQEAESSKKNRQVLDQLLEQAAAAETVAEPTPPIDLEPVPPVASEAPLPASTREALRSFCEDWTVEAMKQFERERRRNPQWAHKPTPLTAADADRLYEAMQRPTKLSDRERARLDRSWHHPDWGERIRELLARPEIEPIHALRFLGLLGEVDLARSGQRWGVDLFSWRAGAFFDHYRASHADRLDLRRLAAVFEALGVDGERVGWMRLVEGWGYRAFRWPPEAVWPYFAERVEILEQVLTGRGTLPDHVPSWELQGVRRSAFEIVAWLPSVPESLLATLWEIALGTRKSERELAQAALATQPNKEPVIVAALADGKQQVRATAAAWLGRLGHREAIPALEKALGQEKQEMVKGALLQTLEDLGADIEPFLDRDRLVAEAAKGLRKAPPKDLAEWFPFDLLPTCRWAPDAGGGTEPIDPQVPRWFVVRCHKLKSPAPGPILRRHCQRMVAADREALGRFVLDAWIARDTRRPSREEADEKAREQVAQWGVTGAQAQRWIKSHSDQAMTQPIGSAIGQKGLLALVAACGGPTVATLAGRYLKTWYGQRAAQCKALLEMLAWVDDDTDGGQATQVLLATANRFRTASIRKHAETLAGELAERRGWTVAELADRTVPSAGLEPADDGPPRLELWYGADDAEGARRFTAVLGDDLTLVLRNPDGKTIKSLPAARKSEDAERVKAVKKELSRAKKELKGVVRLQTDRLYEALCTQRGWTARDWRRFLVGHPIVGRLCRRLVWVAVEPAEDPPAEPAEGDERLLASLRPLADGTLTDAADDAVELPEHSVVRLAHDVNLPRADVAAWLEHLDDYEIEPLFEQIGRDVFELPEERRGDDTLDDFEGHMLEAFVLRSAATKRGYVRGTAEDGGWFLSYHKSFPTLELEAVLEFTGNTLPEENRRVALRSLHLVSTAGEQQSEAWNRPRLRLGDVPPVLLGELWNDLRALAAQGSGFDPDWETKAWE